MKCSKLVLHYTLLTVEIAVIIVVALTQIVDFDVEVVVHEFLWGVITCAALGVGAIIAAFALCRICVVGDTVPIKTINVGWLLLGCALLMGAGGLSLWTFPELTRSRVVMNEVDRWKSMDAVDIRFDPVEGLCADSQRIARVGCGYGGSLNLYPSEDARRMRLQYAKIDLREGFICVALEHYEERWDGYVNYCTSNALPNHLVSGKWTYVVDVKEFEGGFHVWPVGQTAPVDWGAYTQLEQKYVRPTIKAGEKQFLVLDSTKWGEKCNMLDRAYIHLKPGQHLKAKFRVSLFAGTGVNESNYHYVKPGETIACKLPVPTREGYAFEGWYDGDKRVTEETKVVKRETHTLKARWRKL